MNRFRSTYGIWCWFLIDGLCWFVFMGLGLRLRFPGTVPALEWEYFLRFIPIAGSTMLGAFLYAGLYKRDIDNRWDWTALGRGLLLGTALAFGILFLLKIPYSRLAFGYGIGLFIASTVTTRSVWIQFRNFLTDPESTSVIAVGFQSDSKRSELKNRLNENTRIQFVASTDVERIQGSDESLPDIVILNGEKLNSESCRDLLDFGSRRQIPVRIYPSSNQVFFSRSEIITWKDTILLRSRMHYRLRQQMALKTVFDYSLGSLIFLVLSPLMIVISFLIYALEGAPVFYTQERTGRGGNTFTLYKFRTMIRDADQKGPKLTESPDDPRITVLGRFLRRWSLDELPQLLNVLQGDMSLVGPRPEIPSITADYKEDARRLLWLKPGLTGLSQVSGRQKLDIDKKLEIDQFYLAEYTIILDLWILAKTVYVVFTGRGAA